MKLTVAQYEALEDLAWAPKTLSWVKSATRTSLLKRGLAERLLYPNDYLYRITDAGRDVVSVERTK